MPRHDQHCTTCDWSGEVWVKPFEHPPCPKCGAETERLWQQSTSVVDDSIPGGQWIENLGPQPMFFETKSAILQEAKRRGLEPRVRHVPVPGTDKSPHTTSWAAVSPYQLEQARLLLERVGKNHVTPHEDEPVRPLATPALVSELVGNVWD